MNFGHDIEAEVWSTFSRIFLVKTLRLRFGQDSEAEVTLMMKLNFGQGFKTEVWSRL